MMFLLTVVVFGVVVYLVNDATDGKIAAKARELWNKIINPKM